MKKPVSAKLRPGFAPLLLLLGIVAVFLLLGLTIFGPWELPGFGQLGQRQQEQAASAAEIAFPGPDDADKDGFKDSVEKWIGTDVNDNCADDARDAAWPPDFNNDKKVDQADADAFKPHFNSKIGGKTYDKRFDLNADKKINLQDTLLLIPYFGASCPFYFLKATPFVQKIDFTWTPALQDNGTVKLFDVAERPDTACNADSLKKYGSWFGSSISLGDTTDTWDWNAGVRPYPGHTYCAWLNPTNGSSNVIQFTVGLYNITAQPAVQHINFSWTPALEQSNVMTVAELGSGTECNVATMNSGSAYWFGVTSQAGAKEVTWDWNAGVRPLPGGTYCAALKSDSLITSKPFQFTVGLYSLSANPISSTQINFSWTPPLEQTNVMTVLDLTSSPGTECNNTSMNSGSSSWFGISSQPVSTQVAWDVNALTRPAPGHTYCSRLKSNSIGTSTTAQFTVPAQ